MKLKCNHGRRVMVLPSSHTVHRIDGTPCFGGILTFGDNWVTKLYAPDDGHFVTLGSEPLPGPLSHKPGRRHQQHTSKI